ncbi:MAG: fused MFS/spermidine synthase [Opitutales bacterium]|nr:fused MFS/spermidine synthase [Opitutales bacterium]
MKDVPTKGSPALPYFLLLLALAILGGLTALGHQVLWTRRMVDILGGTAESASRVIACFFLGLALGATAAAVWGPKIRRPWRSLTLIEGLIIVTALPFLFLTGLLDSLWQSWGLTALSGWQGSVLKTLASLLAVFPPAFFMGWFLPIAAKGFFPRPEDFQKKGLWLYGLNTLGGVLGLILISLWGLQHWGVTGSFLVLLGLHVLIIGGLLWLDRSIPFNENPNTSPGNLRQAPFATPTFPLGWLLGLSFFSGFAILSFEVISLEILMLVAPLSFHAPAAILIGVIFLLGLAALLAIPLRNGAQHIPLLLVLTGLVTVLSPFLFYFLAQALNGLPPQDSFTAFWIRLLLLSLLSFGPALLFAGFLFPFLSIAWSKAMESLPHAPAQTSRWGWLLAVNGFGGFAGAEIGYRVFMPSFGLYPALGLVAGFYGVLGLTLWFKGPWQTKRNLPIAFGGTTVLLILWTTFTLLPQLPTVNPHLGWQTLWERSGPEGTVSVVEGPGIGRGILVSNQYLLGSVGARWEQERQGHLPLLLHPNPEKVAFLGIATGMTPSAATQQSAPQEIVAMEISRSVLTAAGKFFAEENDHLLANPKVRILREDARLGMIAAEDEFDLIIGDLFLPWGPGEARLYSYEHFAATRRALRPDGLFAQWLPLHQLSREHLASIVHTANEVFPEVHFFLGGFDSKNPLLLLLAGEKLSFSRDTMSRRIEEESSALKDPFLRSLAGIDLLFLGNDLALPQGHLNTLENLHLERRASLDRIVRRPGNDYLTGETLLEWLKESPLPGNFRRIGLPILEHHHNVPHQRRLPANLRHRLPAEMLEDPEIDWSRWTGPSVRP